jgi:hypothetical protein
MMDTLLDATDRLRARGFDLDFAATSSGRLRCRATNVEHDPEVMHIEEIVRYEGASDPNDQAILLALACRCGERGLYSAAFGPDTAEADVTVLHRIPPR